jgi:hypothetical protein
MSTPRGKSFERMNALRTQHNVPTAHSNQPSSSASSETDNSDDDNLPLARKERVASITQMARTRAAQQSRLRGNAQKTRLSPKQKSTAGKFLRPLPSIRKVGTADKNSKKKKSNSKKGDNAKDLHSNEQPPPIGGNDDIELPVEVIGDNPAVDGVTINLATGKNSTKKTTSQRAKRDIASGVGGIDVGATDGGNVRKKKRTKTDKTRGVGVNEQNVTDGGKDGVVHFSKTDETDGILNDIGTADTLSLNDIAVTVLPESKKEIVLISKDVLKKMIKLITKEDFSDNSLVDLLRNLIPIKDYLLQVAANLDEKFVHVDDTMQTMSITGLVDKTFDSFTKNVEGNMEGSTDGEMWVDLVRVWQLVHALYVHSDALGNLLAPSADVDPFYNQLKPIFEKAIASVNSSKNRKSTSSKTLDKNKKKTDELSHHNNSKRSVVIDGKPFKCNGVIVKGDSVKTYTKYFQCNMVLDKSDGSKWKPHNEVVKRVGKNVYPTQLVKCEGTLLGIFSTKNGKQTQHFQPGSKPHICYNKSLTDGVPMETRVPLVLIIPSPSWNIDRVAIESMKNALSNVSKQSWVNQANCSSKRQYLKELSSKKSLETVRKQAESFVGLYMRHFVTKSYPSLTHFKVGALRSRGEESQFDLQGTLHRDYLDDVDNKVPDERPQSIIIALDPFNLLYEYESDCHDDSIGCKSVAKGEAILFTSSLKHAGGSNGTIGDKTWKYRLFAYIVSEESDFPSEVTRLNLK